MMIRVCAMLHNMLREHGLADHGMNEVDWRAVDEAEARKFGFVCRSCPP